MQIAYRFIAEGGEIPWGYGFAWLRYENDTGVFFPIPFNLALGFLRHWYFRLAHGKVWGTRGYSKGFTTGKREGIAEGRNDLRMELKLMKILEEFEMKRPGLPGRA